MSNKFNIIILARKCNKLVKFNFSTSNNKIQQSRQQISNKLPTNLLNGLDLGPVLRFIWIHLSR